MAITPMLGPWNPNSWLISDITVEGMSAPLALGGIEAMPAGGRRPTCRHHPSTLPWIIPTTPPGRHPRSMALCTASPGRVANGPGNRDGAVGGVPVVRDTGDPPDVVLEVRGETGDGTHRRLARQQTLHEELAAPAIAGDGTDPTQRNRGSDRIGIRLCLSLACHGHRPGSFWSIGEGLTVRPRLHVRKEADVVSWESTGPVPGGLAPTWIGDGPKEKPSVPGALAPVATLPATAVAPTGDRRRGGPPNERPGTARERPGRR